MPGLRHIPHTHSSQRQRGRTHDQQRRLPPQPPQRCSTQNKERHAQPERQITNVEHTRKPSAMQSRHDRGCKMHLCEYLKTDHAISMSFFRQKWLESRMDIA
jgi:hypothetical protein